MISANTVLLKIHMISGIAKTTVGEKTEYITSLGAAKVECFITYYLQNYAPL